MKISAFTAMILAFVFFSAIPVRSEQAWTHFICPNGGQGSWKLNGPLNQNPQTWAGNTDTTLNLSRGLYLLELNGGSVCRGSQILAENLSTQNTGNSDPCYCTDDDYSPSTTIQPALLHIGRRESKVYLGADNYRLKGCASAGGTGVASAGFEFTIIGTDYSWSRYADIHFMSYYSCGDFEMKLLPGIAYSATAGATGDSYYPTETPTATPTATAGPTETPAEAVKNELGDTGVDPKKTGAKRSSKTHRAPAVAFLHASGSATIEYIAPSGAWQEFAGAGGYGPPSLGIGPIMAYGPPLEDLDTMPPSKVFWAIY